MTLCIAAHSRLDKELVCVTDLMLSNDWISHDTQTLKMQQISSSRRWIMMFSGDPSCQLNVGRRAKEILTATGGESAPEVVDACERAFRAERQRQIEAEVLGAWGIDVPTFLREGRPWFGDAEFARIAAEMRTVELATEFLVMGFDPEGRSYIFTVDDKTAGLGSHKGNLGLHAIGSGWILALGALATTYDPDLGVDDLVYRMCEAKFLGERAAGVGRKTFVLRLAADGTQHQLLPGAVEPLREIWKEEGQPPPVPETARAYTRSRWAKLLWPQSPTP